MSMHFFNKKNQTLPFKKNCMSNLQHSMHEYVSKELISSNASFFDEKEQHIENGLKSILPCILKGIQDSPSASHNVLSEMFQNATNEHTLDAQNPLISEQDAQQSGLNIGTGLLSVLFGTKTSALANVVSNTAGLKSSTSNHLLKVGATIASTFIGTKMHNDGLNITGVLNWLSSHTTEIDATLPLGFAQLFHTTSNQNAQSINPQKKHSKKHSKKENEDSMKWMLPVILIGLFGIGIWYWLKGSMYTAEKNEQTTSAIIDSAGQSINQAADDAANEIDDRINTDSMDNSTGKMDEAGNWLAAKGEPIKIKLANGVELDATKGSIEDKFYAFLKDPTAVANKDLWFNFDQVLFASGKSTLKTGSEKQLENTCEILKAYPQVKIKIGGYTDNIGDSLANVKLSTARAKTVYTFMLNKGVEKTSFDEKPFEGYGPLYAVADNNTKEGQAQNRRISLSVRAK